MCIYVYIFLKLVKLLKKCFIIIKSMQLKINNKKYLHLNLKHFSCLSNQIIIDEIQLYQNTWLMMRNTMKTVTCFVTKYRKKL